MAVLTRINKANTIGIDINQNAIIISREDFPINIDAGKIDRFIENHYPNLINRTEGEVNGVSVTNKEIIITLAQPLTDQQKDTIVEIIQNATWT